jgi:serine/threonine-protein kinase
MRPGLVAGANEYRLLERVATTALGSVHRAIHVASGRAVEVRLLQRLAEDPRGALAFSETMPAIAALRHRGILPVEAWGDTDDVPSVVNPLPHAEPLFDRLATGRLPDRAAALRLLREIAAAVDHAHRLGVVHGDLQPETVLVTAEGSALVAHFGLAAMAGATALPGGTALRHGSPRHVAPERFPAGTLGPAADVYALTVIAWQLLTGRLPPAGMLPPPAAVVLQRGLERDPSARWPTCGDLVRALEAALSGAAPVGPAASPSPEPPPPAGRLAGIPARNWVAAAGGLLLLGVLGAVIATAERPGGSTATANRGRQVGTPAVQSSLTPLVPPSDSPSPAPSATATPTAAPVPAATVRPSQAPTPRPSPTSTPAAASLSMSVSNTRPRAGDSVTITGHGFDPTQQYQVYFVQALSTQPLYGPASPTPGGDFGTPSVRIPIDAEPGPAVVMGCVYVVNRGPDLGRCATVPISIRD